MRGRRRTAGIAVLLAATAIAAAPADAGTIGSLEQQLEEAKQRRVAVEERLATEAGDLEGLEQQAEDVSREIAALEQQDATLRAELGEIEEAVAMRSRLAFMHGDRSALQVIVAAQDLTDAADAAAMLESLALRDRASLEDAAAVRTRLATNRAERESRLGELRELEGALQEKVDRLLADLDQLARDEERFGDQLREARAEERRRREAEEARKAAAAAAAEKATAAASGAADRTAASTPAAKVSGDLACPVGNPVAFSDTWGAPRSGGRRHKGVDMMARHGTPVYAITAGKITRMNGNRLGGISLYMYGDDGNQYYYTHLQGYADVRVGQRVSAGTLIAYVGSTGNASASAPHLHFELHPGGGGAVNPYPTVARACGR